MQLAAMASTSAAAPSGGIVPARLGFLAIFNPSLGMTDETVDDQIVYYSSVTTQASKRRRSRTRPIESISQEERNERLRQIGLAQGMASFSRDFSNGASVDVIDTETSKVIMHELEAGWWILASIDLSKAPLPPRLPTKNDRRQEERFEHSTKEMKPAALLLRDLLRAHSQFLLHHDSSLGALFVRCRRAKFVALLGRYWDLFLSTWNVMLHGNPARSVFGGINLAASGELGVGVGEEDRGSGERDVLEGLPGRVEGLVDLVVSKFGTDLASEDPKQADKGQDQPWLGTGREPDAVDGAIFLGTGALSSKSLRDVTHWMEDLYTWGEHAYGVFQCPTSIRRNKARHVSHGSHDIKSKAAEPRTGTAAASSSPPPPKEAPAQSPPRKEAEDGKLDRMLNYMKLGYGSYWTIYGTGSAESSASEPTKVLAEQATAKSDEQSQAHPSKEPSARLPADESVGYYLIGLKGDIEERSRGDLEAAAAESNSEAESNSRTVLRTVHVELESDTATDRAEAGIAEGTAHSTGARAPSRATGSMLASYCSRDCSKTEKLRAVVYVNRPLIFALFFRLHTDSLAWDALYRSLHGQLAPLMKPLLASTKYRPEKPDASGSSNSIYNLVWDPLTLTLHSTIPNIPELVRSDCWSRADAVNTHLHLLSIHLATQSCPGDLERTQKTNRGWWLVWTRLLSRPEVRSNLPVIYEASASHSPSPSPSSDAGRSKRGGDDDGKGLPPVAKEVFLIRRASDHSSFRGSVDEGGGGGGGADAARRLAQGIGVDTRRYIEELLSFL
ncbi:Vacuolar fusion protein CCZ1 like protein [Drechmeria coniospora]|uniref:Vacuolar fusion protein CCZ1 like protein n=1 Tax=Drechmeria coniospora TaxID=98403 RepID=A0A151GTR3_DRECN|nr:Vacuolar fusion protein CCZ1 like protein [Drechmeria coniospora]KYK60487.1 Vacuolar fusion protein CCZ1 like protein [Drechmeria coniospora]